MNRKNIREDRPFGPPAFRLTPARSPAPGPPLDRPPPTQGEGPIFLERDGVYSGRPSTIHPTVPKRMQGLAGVGARCPTRQAHHWLAPLLPQSRGRFLWQSKMVWTRRFPTP